MINQIFLLLRLLIGGILSVLLLTTMATSIEAASVPDWVKNNAGWWSEGAIADSDFITGIQYLI